MSFEDLFKRDIPMGEAASFFVGLKKFAAPTDPPDETGQLEGMFTVPIEQAMAIMQEVAKAEFESAYAYHTYAESVRCLSRDSLAEHFQEHAADELDHYDFLVKRMAVLGGPVHVQDIPAPHPSTDPVDIIKTLIRMEQEGIAGWRKLMAVMGENPMRITVEEYAVKEQEHLDDLWQLLPDEAKGGVSPGQPLGAGALPLEEEMEPLEEEEPPPLEVTAAAMRMAKCAADLVPGGRADKKPDADFSPEQLAMGKKVEMEHTDDPRLADEIARDHLTEFPDYYSRLKKMEDAAKGSEGKSKEGSWKDIFSRNPDTKKHYEAAAAAHDAALKAGKSGKEAAGIFDKTLAAQKAKTAMAKLADDDDEEGGRAPTAEDKEAIRQFITSHPGLKDDDFHEFLEERGIKVPLGEAAAYSLVPKEKAAAMRMAKMAAVLTQAGREKIKSKNFAIPKGNGPGDTGKYPIHDTTHARAALQMVDKHGTPAEKSKVYSAVAKKYPGLSARSSIPAVQAKAKEKDSCGMKTAATLEYLPEGYDPQQGMNYDDYAMFKMRQGRGEGARHGMVAGAQRGALAGGALGALGGGLAGFRHGGLGSALGGAALGALGGGTAGTLGGGYLGRGSGARVGEERGRAAATRARQLVDAAHVANAKKKGEEPKGPEEVLQKARFKIAAAEKKTDSELKETGRERAVTSLAAEAHREKGRRGERFGQTLGSLAGAGGGALAGRKYVGGPMGTLGGAALGYLAGGKLGKEVGTERDIHKNAAAMRFQKALYKLAQEPGDAPMASPTAGNMEATNYLNAELAGRQAQEQAESQFYKGQLQSVQQQNAQMQQQIADTQAQLDQIQQQAQQAGSQIQQATQQAVAAQDEATRQTQEAARARIGAQQMRAQMLQLASQDPEMFAAQQMPPTPPGPEQMQQGAPGPEAGAEAPTEGPPAEQAGPAGEAPAPEQPPGGGPPAEGNSPPGGTMPAGPGGAPVGPGAGMAPAGAPPQPKTASVADRAIMGALGAGVGAGGSLWAGSQAPRLAEKVQELEAGQGGTFLQAARLAAARKALAGAELAQEHPVGAALAGGLTGGLTGALGGQTTMDKARPVLRDLREVFGRN